MNKINLSSEEFYIQSLREDGLFDRQTTVAVQTAWVVEAEMKEKCVLKRELAPIRVLQRT